MREIKFRAWDKENKEMVYDDGDLAIFRTIKRMAYKSNHRTHDFMQFTGLKDKNGVDIYEGDIIEWDGHTDSPQRMTMAWHKDKQGFLPFINTTSEVIGNIYEQAQA